MPRFKMTMKGNKALIKFLEEVNEKAVKGINDVIHANADAIDDAALNRSPHDSGFLRNHFNVQKDTLRARIENTAHYAPYVEFGTGGMVDVPAGLKDYAMQFKGKGIKQVNLPPRPFLFPAFETQRPQLIKDIKQVLKDSTK